MVGQTMRTSTVVEALISQMEHVLLYTDSDEGAFHGFIALRNLACLLGFGITDEFQSRIEPLNEVFERRCGRFLNDC
ncbi:hypothetical protein AAC03nite_38710 [Alicyclobacillus acidoterrestris]|nr:hypothetical protein AAC03nite_38710 [Alicyclobacillus acidoterrestris]